MVIFIASVVVPCIKFLALGVLLFTAQLRNHWVMPTSIAWSS